VDAIGGSPVFLLLTRDYPAETRRVLARRITVNSFVLLIASYTMGSRVLSLFGISIPVVQVGGLIVISAGWAMLNQQDGGDRDTVSGRTVTCADALNQAFYPLTLPLTVGPGSISVAITPGANETTHHLGASLLALLAAATGCAFVAATVYPCYAFADRLASVMGPSGMNVILRLSSFLLVCIGVQILGNGASKLRGSFAAGRRPGGVALKGSEWREKFKP